MKGKVDAHYTHELAEAVRFLNAYAQALLLEHGYTIADWYTFSQASDDEFHDAHSKVAEESTSACAPSAGGTPRGTPRDKDDRQDSLNALKEHMSPCPSRAPNSMGCGDRPRTLRTESPHARSLQGCTSTTHACTDGVRFDSRVRRVVISSRELDEEEDGERPPG